MIMKKITTLILAVIMALPLLAQIEKKVIIEHFTNTRCGICASKNPAFYETLSDYPNVLHIAYHPSAPYASCIFNMHNVTDNDTRTYYYGIYGGTPRAVVQGEVLPVASKLITADQIEGFLEQTSDYSVTVKNESITSERYKVTVTINRETGSGQQVFQLMVGLAEKEIDYAAPNGENVHHDVFRDKIYHDTASVNVGNTKTYTVEYDVHPDWNQDQIYAYVVLQNPDSKEIYQAASSLESPSSIQNKNDQQSKMVFYPNPTTGLFKILPEFSDEIEMIEIYSFAGQKVKTYHEFLNMSLDGLPEGIYFSKITLKTKNSMTTRIIKSGH